MTSAFPISGLMSASDNGRQQILCEVRFPEMGRLESIAFFFYKLTYSKIVTGSAEISADEISEIASRLMEKTSRALRLVIRRDPKPYRPFESEPSYLLCYVIEQLECGHTLTVYPQGDPLIAKRRVCSECSDLISALPPKKPVQSVRFTKKVGAA